MWSFCQGDSSFSRQSYTFWFIFCCQESWSTAEITQRTKLSLCPAKWKRVQNYLMDSRQNFLYSIDINKIPVELFVLPYLTVFFIYQYHHMPKKKICWAKKTRLDDITFDMTSFWAKKSNKLSLLGEEKYPKPLVSKVP